MSELPNHTQPTFSEEARENTLFHYTTGNGLLGILSKNEIWSTAYYCTNDETELRAGRGVLTPLFLSKTHKVVKAGDSRVLTICRRGANIWDYANGFEEMIFRLAVSLISVYITCFCRPSSEEDFLHGLLSQWRGYGADGGYALQFNRTKLQERVEQINKVEDLNYHLQDVHYSPNNSLKVELLDHTEVFTNAYLNYLDTIANFDLSQKSMRNPLASLPHKALLSLLDYLIQTKSTHFSEEKECRLSLIDPISNGSKAVVIDYFNRNGLLVPFTRTPTNFNILDCVDWIIVGPSPRIDNRFHSVSQMVRNMGLNIKVRPSHIPFSRS